MMYFFLLFSLSLCHCCIHRLHVTQVNCRLKNIHLCAVENLHLLKKCKCFTDVPWLYIQNLLLRGISFAHTKYTYIAHTRADDQITG